MKVLKLERTSNARLNGFCGREYFKEIGLNNYYCIEDETLYFCSKDGEPEFQIDEKYCIEGGE
jgi:hypothetical protein